MSKRVAFCSAALVLVCAAGVANVRGEHRGRTLVVTMTNDPIENRINVYDADTHTLLQRLSTHGKGGVGGNARGVRQHDGELVAAVNNGSNTVAVFRRDGDILKFDKVVSTSSAPVSVDFGNDHMYVAGATTVDSFRLHRNTVEWLDGTSGLELVGGGTPPSGSTAQVGVINDKQLLVTLKTDPDPGTVDLVSLDEGRVTGAVPTAVSAPQGTLTPFGFAVYRDGTAVITLAHSNQDGLFRSTGSHVFVDSQVAAAIATGGAPTDIDADAGVLGVIDHGAGQSHLSLFRYNEFGELTAQGTPITVGVPNANGVAILSADDRDRT